MTSEGGKMRWKLLFFIALLTCSFASEASAKPEHSKPAHAARKHHRAPAAAPAANYAALVVNADTGDILYQKSAHERRYPASLTKMMTLYLTFQALERHDILLSTEMTASEYAATQPPSSIDLREGDTITVDEALRGVVVKSGNDAAVVLAEHIGGSTEEFARRMTATAHQLGMRDTRFRNPNGLPDPDQYTTAYDMAILGLALKRDFPQYYHYFKVNQFVFKGKNYMGHNHVLARFNGADGIKTGYIRASGYNLVSSAERDNQRLIGVVLGENTAKARDNRMIRLLTKAYSYLKYGHNTDSLVTAR